MTEATLETPVRGDTASESSEQANADVSQIVSFQLGEEEFGLDIMKVQEIILVGEITKMPQVPEYVRGMINLRGHVIPVVDLRKRFRQPPCEKTEEQRIIVVNIASRTIGIVVDAVNEVLRMTPDQIEPAPSGIGSDVQNFITGLDNLVIRLIAGGVETSRLQAKLVGGAAMFGKSSNSLLGDRNVETARQRLQAHGVPVVAEAVGGTKGRKMLLDPNTGEIEVAIIGAEPQII